MEEKTIKDCKTFEEVRQMRIDLDTQIRRNGDEYDRVLTDIYKKPSHFIFELMQNANDAKATKARFVLNDNSIEFYHNGTKDFDLPSIIGITRVGNSDKKDDPESIGRYGIGFKSVFKVTKSPKIYNRLCSFKIERLRIPTKIQPKPLPDGYTTEFELSFNAESGLTKLEMFKQIKKELGSLNALSLMFLQNLKYVEIMGKAKAKIQLIEKKTRQGFTVNSNASTNEEYIIFRGGTKNRIAIAYYLENDCIEPCEDTEISVYFPTQVESGLSFRVNAPFDTPVTREEINFDTKYNKIILKEVGDVFEESIIRLRDAGYFNYDFMENILPIRNWNDEEMYLYLKQRLVKLFKTNALIPINNNEFRKSTHVYLSKESGIQTLWTYKNKPWVSIPEYYNEINSFLTQNIGVKTISFYQFANDISKELKRSNPLLDTEWLYDFYSYCGRSDHYYQLKEVPIIKNRANGYVSAWKNDSQNIFKPPAKGVSNTKILNKILSDDALERLAKEDYYKSNNIKTLLSQLEIRERSPKSTIEMDIMSKWDKTKTVETRRKLFNAIVDIYNSANKDEKTVIENYLRDKKIFYGNYGKSNGWYKGLDLYSRDDYIVNTLKCQKVVFIDRRFWSEKYKEITNKNGDITKKCIGSSELCEMLGVSRSLKVEKYENYSTIRYEDIKNKYKADIYENTYGYGYRSDKTIRNIEKIIQSINTKTDVKNFSLALAGISEDDVYAVVGASSERTYINASSPSIKIPAHFLRYINDAKWIIENNKRITLRDITREKFIKMTGLEGTEPFLNHIKFEPDGLQNLSDAQREAYEIVSKMSEEELLKFKKERSKEKEDVIKTDDKPVIDFSNFKEIILKKYVPIVDEKYDDAGTKHTPKGETRPHKQKTKTSTKTTSNYKKQLGDEGEEETNRKLEKRFPEKDGYSISSYRGNHKAYDFKVEKDGKTIKFIDSKYTQNGIVDLSPSQVNAARKYRDKYEIYAYIGDEKKFTIIVDPYKLFMDGEIKGGISLEISNE